ncbi:acyl-CoA carboxylase subunit epsilon [Streptomyces sp. GD-15H]|uniref:acyl-CoA carboxylase subunit epsilon n=1 Tax=Streptomyces sp. GD-15H TaxID=3129112 RepID=UPI00324B6F69
MRAPDDEKLRVVRGTASPEELAAVTVVLLTLVHRRPPAPAGHGPVGRARWEVEGGGRGATSWQRGPTDGFGARPCCEQHG